MKCRNCKNNTLLDDGKQFSWCEICKDNLDIDEERYCGAFSQATNADRIRAMTDEELAEWFFKIQDEIAAHYDSCHAYSPKVPTMEESWLDWLKQECD